MVYLFPGFNVVLIKSFRILQVFNPKKVKKRAAKKPQGIPFQEDAGSFKRYLLNASESGPI